MAQLAISWGCGMQAPSVCGDGVAAFVPVNQI